MFICLFDAFNNFNLIYSLHDYTFVKIFRIMIKNGRCIVVYESIYNGNTKKIAREISQILGCEMVNTQEASKIDLSAYSVIGFGSGIYFGSHHPSLLQIANNLDTSNQSVFIFSSRGNPIHGRYHSPLRDILINKGKKIAGEFTVRGYDGTGPFLIFGGGNCGKPDERDLKSAEKFIRKTFPEYCLQDYYKLIKHPKPVKEGAVNKYNIDLIDRSLVLKGDLVTINQSLCSGCKLCENICPVNVIAMNNNKAFPANELDCTLCSLCVKICKNRAINLHYNWIDTIRVAKRHSAKKSL